MAGGRKGGKKPGDAPEETFKFNFAEGGVDPGLVNAISRQLGGIVGKSSGYYESLPKVVKNRIRALKKLHNSKLEIDQEYKKAREELERKYAERYNVIYEKRTSFVLGKVEPKEEDMAEEEEEGVTIEEVKEEPKESKAEDRKGIPEFWLNVLKHNGELCENIFPPDEEALKFLTDIKCKLFQEEAKPEEKKEKTPKKGGEEKEEEEEPSPRHGFTLEFYFDENPFFDNKLITKTYYLTDDLVYGDMYESAEASEINWKEGKNLTIKKVQKKQKKKSGRGKRGGGETRTVEVEERVDSFFNFFYPDEMISEEPDEEDEAYLEADYELGVIIKDTIIPNAVLWFTGEISDEMNDFGFGSFGEGDEEEEDEEFAPPPSAPGEKPAECKQQ